MKKKTNDIILKEKKCVMDKVYLRVSPVRKI